MKIATRFSEVELHQTFFWKSKELKKTGHRTAKYGKQDFIFSLTDIINLEKKVKLPLKTSKQHQWKVASQNNIFNLSDNTYSEKKDCHSFWENPPGFYTNERKTAIQHQWKEIVYSNLTTDIQVKKDFLKKHSKNLCNVIRSNIDVNDFRKTELTTFNAVNDVCETLKVNSYFMFLIDLQYIANDNTIYAYFNFDKDTNNYILVCRLDS